MVVLFCTLSSAANFHVVSLALPPTQPALPCATAAALTTLRTSRPAGNIVWYLSPNCTADASNSTLTHKKSASVCPRFLPTPSPTKHLAPRHPSDPQTSPSLYRSSHPQITFSNAPCLGQCTSPMPWSVHIPHLNSYSTGSIALRV